MELSMAANGLNWNGRSFGVMQVYLTTTSLEPIVVAGESNADAKYDTKTVGHRIQTFGWMRLKLLLLSEHPT